MILTIGKARTFDKHLPPAFLGAFDSEKIAFIPYNEILDIFYQNDFNWNVAPSDHATKEFRQILAKVKAILEKDMMLYYFANDEKELRHFIRHNFIVGKSEVSKIRINKNNFVNIYLKWLNIVKPTIAIDWDVAKKESIIDADFYLADILSERNITLRDKLYVVLRNDRYYYNKQLKATGAISFDVVEFSDQQKAHNQFWNRYSRPPRREYWDSIIGRRDLLVPQDIRERKGSYFTPQCWVELSQQYLADELGENWQDEYYIWDCAAGTGNLLAGLTNKYNIWASTLDRADVDVMYDRIRNGANLLESHVFQFDFLNDYFYDTEDMDGKMVYTKLPKSLQDVINDPQKRKKLIIYINPPYAEHGNRKTFFSEGEHKASVANQTRVYKDYAGIYGSAMRQLYAQFFAKIHNDCKGCIIASFSTMKYINAQNFQKFRKYFSATFKNGFICNSKTFDNVKSRFPIGFLIWNTDTKEQISSVAVDVYDDDTNPLGRKKTFQSFGKDEYISNWLRKYYDKKSDCIGYMILPGVDMQQQSGVYITSLPTQSDIKQHKTATITIENLIPMCIYLTCRQCIVLTWENNCDQFLYPHDGWQGDTEFQSDCLVFTLFNNNIQSEYGINHWIPYREEEVDAKERFKSHFIHDFMCGKIKPRSLEEQEAYEKDDKNYVPGDAFATSDNKIGKFFDGKSPMTFSDTAQTVLDAGRELWRYYHSQEKALANASFYDIRLHFQGINDKGKMNTKSDDERYTELVLALRQCLKTLAKKIEPKIYEYGFLKE